MYKEAPAEWGNCSPLLYLPTNHIHQQCYLHPLGVTSLSNYSSILMETTYKIGVLGPQEAGKTSLLTQLCHNAFQETVTITPWNLIEASVWQLISSTTLQSKTRITRPLRLTRINMLWIFLTPVVRISIQSCHPMDREGSSYLCLWHFRTIVLYLC